MAKRKSNRTAKGGAAEPKRAVSLAVMGDLGAQGPAIKARVVVETVKDIDPETGKGAGTMKRARVVDMVDHWLRKGVLTTEQWNTAVFLRAAWERTEQAPGTDYARPRVDSSPKPDHAVAIMIDRVSKLNSAWSRVRGDDRELIHHCVVRGLIPATLRIRGVRPYHGSQYQRGLQALRDALDRASHN